jgi:glutaminase
MRRRPDRGEVATYTPELARVDAKAFGLVVIDVDGRVAAAGDSEMSFSIQSISGRTGNSFFLKRGCTNGI